MTKKYSPLLLLLLAIAIQVPAKPRLVLDCDTANEIDDPYAIIPFLLDDSFEILALNSAQWFHRRSGDRTVYQSQELNLEILRLLNRTDVPALVGSNDIFGNWWHGTDPADSPAAQGIIELARSTPDGEKLYVVCTGAFTNVASAIRIAPDIIPKLAVYVIGWKYDYERDVWKKDEFNVQRDLAAADYLLNQEGLELHNLPANLAGQIVFEKADAFERLEELGDVGAFLIHRWHMNGASRKRPRWTMWDIAITQALLHPELASEKKVTTPPDNKERQIWLYDSIDAKEMTKRFWEALQQLPKEP